jgi:hypothetical protein
MATANFGIPVQNVRFVDIVTEVNAGKKEQ